MSNGKRQFANLLCWILTICTVLVVVGGRGWTATTASTLQSQMPGVDAQQLWKYITKDNPYPSWKNFPNLPGRFLHVKENPHGDWIAAYLNNEAYASVNDPSNPFEMRYGSIIVKENYALTNGDPSQAAPLTSVPVALVSLTVMYKVKGYRSAPNEEEWFWVMYGCSNGKCDGTVATISSQPWLSEQIPLSKDTFAFYKGAVMAGKPWLCIECHQRATQPAAYAFGDYVWKLKFFEVK